jgi:hypothetical protein
MSLDIPARLQPGRMGWVHDVRRKRGLIPLRKLPVGDTPEFFDAPLSNLFSWGKQAWLLKVIVKKGVAGKVLAHAASATVAPKKGNGLEVESPKP